MDAFEQIIGQLLVEEKYWVRHSVKIDLTPEEKRSINKPSTLRPEIDIVAYNTISDPIYLLEVKSYLDSPGVVYEHVAMEQDEQTGRYKLLTAPGNTGETATCRLVQIRSHPEKYKDFIRTDSWKCLQEQRT